MKILISPAKLMNINDLKEWNKPTKPFFLDNSKIIIENLKLKNPTEISKMMNISMTLSELNWQRNQNWKENPTKKESSQAIFSFKGEVYRGLKAETMSEQTLNYAQKNLFMLSGLYGILRPLDQIMEYRLEMGSNFKFIDYKNLYDFWGNSITEFLNNNLKNNEPLINLASNEYSKVINKKKLINKLITIEFKELKDGKYKSIMVYIKNARGAFSRFILENQLKNIEDLKKFNEDSYVFNHELSDESLLVFTR